MNSFKTDSRLDSDPSYLPLLLASKHVAAENERFPLDRIRMQKAVFLVSRGRSRRVDQWRGEYTYRPYNWGPYSAQLNNDLIDWQRRGLMILSFAGDGRHGRYVLTREGAKLADRLWTGLEVETQMFLSQIRAWVTGRDFNTLLREVYEEFPEFATNSQWRDTT